MPYKKSADRRVFRLFTEKVLQKVTLGLKYQLKALLCVCQLSDTKYFTSMFRPVQGLSIDIKYIDIARNLTTQCAKM